MVSASDKPAVAKGSVPVPVMHARRIGLNTGDEAVVLVRTDCPVCRSEGFTTRARVRLTSGAKSIIATLYMIDDIIAPGDAGLSEAAWRELGVADGAPLMASHPKPLESMGKVRSKIYGDPLDATELASILEDIVHGRYSDVQLTAFITACSARAMDRAEIIALTRAMVDVGERLKWDRYPVVDKHCVGGLPGNRTTPIVVAVVAASGLMIPKTSSRAITSPAGTADTMETLTPVALSMADMRRVVETEGGCFVWGGAMQLSPADEILIRVERALDIDSPGQLVASVLSKKIAAGSTHVVIDMPVGTTAKVRSAEAAEALTGDIKAVAHAFGLGLEVIVSDGSQPVGYGIGPALEARDVCAVLQGSAEAPPDLRKRALTLSGTLLELGGKALEGEGFGAAEEILDSGSAWEKFQRICEAQGGMHKLPVPLLQRPVLAEHAGTIVAIDNRRMARIAKLAGAPEAKAAGIDLHARLGERVEKDQPLFSIHAETHGELAYALGYIESNDDPVVVASDA